MVEIAHKRIEVRRERVGLHEDGVRGLNASPATVEEAIERLKEVEGRFRAAKPVGKCRKHVEGTEDADITATEEANARIEHNTEILPTNLPPASTKKHAQPRNPPPVFRQGRIIHRPEPELKTHTSYLVFAVLPQEWSTEDEAQARARWPVKPKEGGLDAAAGIRGKKSKRQMKREAGVAAAAEERGEEDMGVDAEAMDLQLGGDETADGAANGS
jgi:tRNA (adenine57-N1/adenine58-N1)-methyltransferase catalytic subunit